MTPRRLIRLLDPTVNITLHPYAIAGLALHAGQVGTYTGRGAMNALGRSGMWLPVVTRVLCSGSGFQVHPARR